MQNKAYFMENKEQNIERLKQILTVKNLQIDQLYDMNSQLYEQYKKYQTDSAVSYILKNRELANRIGQEELQQESAIRLAWLYSSQGRYIESQNLLDSLDQSRLSKRLLPDYYEAYDALCSRYGQSTKISFYYRSEIYRDSLLSVLDNRSLRYWTTYSAKMLYGAADAEPYLLPLLEETKGAGKGLVAYYLGYMYQERNNSELSKKYYMMSIISDIENCVKDNASMQALALAYYAEGDIDNAYLFLQSAIDDATFCNVRCRMVEFSESFPIISDAYRAKELKQKANIQLALYLISFLLVCLIVAIFYTYRQMKRLSIIRKELYHTNQKLSELNNNLVSANVQLKDSNLIKEEYIAHFFDLCSTYIDKMESYRKTLNKYASKRQIEELFKLLRSTTLIETELEELYKKFDVIFINLYPSFVEEFNALQTKQEQTALKSGELLNTELRIFALIRLGITDSVKIASFLRYSLSTIYNYRVKARNNAVVPRDEFEKMVMKIGTDINKQD
ncbi:hypothetical protein AGMMS49574_05160 [Bacteroidia bacterium]|nr:hypothetical protein AGMMS49574_05160 [Bacteroidia bacterium]